MKFSELEVAKHAERAPETTACPPRPGGCADVAGHTEINRLIDEVLMKEKPSFSWKQREDITEESPRPFVAGPMEPLVDPAMVGEIPSTDTRSPPCLHVDVSWQIEQQQAPDFARWFTGHSSPSDNLAMALANNSNYLRVAISKQRHAPARRKLEPRIIAVQKAAKEVLRFVRKLTPSHKAQAKQDKKWRAAIKNLGCLHENPEVLYGLFLGEPIQFRCEDSEFIACLRIVDTVRNNPSKDPSAELASYEDRFIADLELIVNLAEAYKSLLKKPLKNRMTATPSERAPHHGEEQRLKDARTWSSELYCAGIILAAFAWRDPHFDWPCEKWEACEDFWIASGGPAHDGADDDAYKVWSRYLNAAKRTVGGVWRIVERDFGPSLFRSFDEPVSIPKSLRDNSVCRKGCKKTRKSNRGDLVTLQEAKSFIAKLPETEREKKAWRDAIAAVDDASIGVKPTRFARGRLERAFDTPDDPVSSWYDLASSNESLHPPWVTTVKNQLLEYLRADGSDAVDELARKFNLKPTLAKQLLHELVQEKLWPSS
jgi:hypothetical protein